jgi:hypothetical protein
VAQENTDWWSGYWKTHNFDPSLPQPKIVTPEKWNGYQINFGDLIAFLFGKYTDSSAGIMASEGKAIENEVARLLGLRSGNKRTTLTDHFLAGQTTLGQVLYSTNTTGPEIIAKLIADCGEITRPKWQQEVSIDVHSPTGIHAGFFNRKFDLVADKGIFEIKTHLPKDPERILIDLAIMAICWPVLKHGLVQTITYPWDKLRALKPGVRNSFERISPKIGPTFAIVGTDGIITGEDVDLNMRLAKEYQAKIYRTLLEMLAVK